MIYPTIIKSGTYQYPTLVIEKFLSRDEGYDNLLINICQSFIEDLRFTIEKNDIIIYREWNNQKFIQFSVSVKPEFIKVVNKVVFLLVEFHFFILNFDYKILEKVFVEAFLFSHTKPEEILFKSEPKFNIKSKNKYINFYKRGELCQT